MSYSDKIRHMFLQIVEEGVNVSPSKCFAQYNPDRFKQWMSVCSNENDPLDMIYSPHMDYLYFLDRNGKCEWTREFKAQVKKTAYYEMHIQYGKSPTWAIRKCRAFRNLYFDIKKKGRNDEPVQLLTEPIEPNPYNTDMEIYEGHHRVAICAFLGIEVFADIFKAQPF